VFDFLAGDEVLMQTSERGAGVIVGGKANTSSAIHSVSITLGSGFSSSLVARWLDFEVIQEF
jgi:hypothetical protein